MPQGGRGIFHLSIQKASALEAFLSFTIGANTLQPVSIFLG